MNYHQSNAFLQDRLNSFHRWLNLSILHSGVPQQFLVVLLIVIINIWRPKKSFFAIISVLLKILGLSCCHPLIIVSIVSTLFIVGSTSSLFILPEYLNKSGWCFSLSFSTFEDRRRVFSSKSYPFSQRCVVQSWSHPLIIVFDCENRFHPSGAIQESFQFDSPEPIIS